MLGNGLKSGSDVEEGTEEAGGLGKVVGFCD